MNKSNVLVAFVAIIGSLSASILCGFGSQPADKYTMAMETWKNDPNLRDPIIAFKPDATSALLRGKVYQLQADTKGNWGFHDMNSGVLSVDDSDSWVIIQSSALNDREFVIKDRELQHVTNIDHRGWWGRNFGWAAFWN